MQIIENGTESEVALLPTETDVAPSFSEIIPAARDEHGRFLSGNSGGGRKKGSRNKLTEMLLNTIVDDLTAHGANALANLRQKDPECYFRVIASLVPKSLILKQEEAPAIDYASLSIDEAAQLLEDARRRRLIEQAIEAVSR